MSVEHGQDVEFQCVTTAWFPNPTVSWSQDGGAVDSSLYNTTIMADGDYFNSSSFLKFQAVSSTTVECLATVSTLTVPQSSSVFLTVGKKVLQNIQYIMDSAYSQPFFLFLFFFKFYLCEVLIRKI